jgi:hypothetical protein
VKGAAAAAGGTSSGQQHNSAAEGHEGSRKQKARSLFL